MIHCQKRRKNFYSNKEKDSMTKQRAIHKFLLIFNSFLALLLLCSYFLPYVSPKKFPALSVLSLGVPILIIVNIAFFVFWLLRRKKELCISLITLVLGFNYVTSLFLISKKEPVDKGTVSVMSYNVRGFYHLGWKQKPATSVKVFDFIQNENPDIVAIQEYFVNPELKTNFPYEFVQVKTSGRSFGSAIFSKYEILNSGSLDFKESHNNAIFADLKIANDTVRVYNIHLESLGVNPNKENFGQENSEKLYQRVKSTFSKQAQQTEVFLEHLNLWKGKTIICSDLNNTAFSWVYNEVSEGMSDTFLKAGKGFGKTYNYPFPLRIDFIFTDPLFETSYFKTYSDQKSSDHFPIMANLHIK